MIDHALVKPELTGVQVMEGLELAKRCHVASATVRPCDIELAVRTLEGSPVRPASVCGFPHGSENTATKLYETRDLLRRGAKEIDMVVAISKLLSREFQHVQVELLQMSELCHKEGAILKVILETAYLTDELKIIACRCAARAEVDFVQTSTGFAPADSDHRGRAAFAEAPAGGDWDQGGGPAHAGPGAGGLRRGLFARGHGFDGGDSGGMEGPAGGGSSGAGSGVGARRAFAPIILRISEYP